MDRDQSGKSSSNSRWEPFGRRRFIQLAGAGVGASLIGGRAFGQAAAGARWGMTAQVAEEWAGIEEAALKEGEVTYYGQGLLAPNQIGDLESAFNADYPGIKVNLLNVGSGQEVVARVTTEQEAKQYSGDVMDTSVRQGLASLDPHGYTQSFIPPAGRDPSVEFYTDPSPNPGMSGVTVWRDQFQCNFVNTDLVKPEDYPQTIYDFSDPKHRGGIVWNQPWSVGSGWNGLYFVRKHYSPAEADEWVRRMTEQEITFSSRNSDAMNQLARGEFRLAFSVNSSTTTTELFRSGAPIAALWPTDYTISAPGCAVLLNGAPHANAAKVLINWFLTENGQKFWASVGQWPVRKDTPKAEPWMSEGPKSEVIYSNSEISEEEQAVTIAEAEKVFKS